MKVYIIQPMRGLEEEEILAEREKGMQAVRAYYPDAEFLENYYEDYDDTISPLEYLSRSLHLMAQADLVVMLPKYLGSYGCEVEEHTAQVYNVPRMIIDITTAYRTTAMTPAAETAAEGNEES